MARKKQTEPQAVGLDGMRKIPGVGKLPDKVGVVLPRGKVPTKEEKLEILDGIVKSANVATSDKLRALEILNRMQGHNEAEKLDLGAGGDLLLAIRSGEAARLRSEYPVTEEKPGVLHG